MALVTVLSGQHCENSRWLTYEPVATRVILMKCCSYKLARNKSEERASALDVVASSFSSLLWAELPRVHSMHCLSTVWPTLHSKSPTGTPLPLERIVCKTHSSPRVMENGIMSKYCWSMVLITPRLVGLIPICLRAGLDPCGPSSSEYPAAVILWDVLGGGSALQGPSSPCIFEVPGLDARRQSRGMGERMIWRGRQWTGMISWTHKRREEVQIWAEGSESDTERKTLESSLHSW